MFYFRFWQSWRWFIYQHYILVLYRKTFNNPYRTMMIIYYLHLALTLWLHNSNHLEQSYQNQYGLNYKSRIFFREIFNNRKIIIKYASIIWLSTMINLKIRQGKVAIFMAKNKSCHGIDLVYMKGLKVKAVLCLY